MIRRLGLTALLLIAVAWGADFASRPPGAIAGPMVDPSPRPGIGDGLAAEGARWWTRSPDPGNPVACATCHHDPAATRGWAASFPKVKPLPPPHTRVMTLLQANAEAIARHYRLPDPRPAAVAITAYLTTLGANLPLTPGVSEGQPVFPERIRLLARSVARGATLFAGRCGRCHDATVTAAATQALPRVANGRAESLEGFLERHHPAGERLRWDGQAMADVIAYLMSRLAGRPLGRLVTGTAEGTP